MRPLIFDLGGTLADTVYAHVFAWERARLCQQRKSLDELGIALPPS